MSFRRRFVRAMLVLAALLPALTVCASESTPPPSDAAAMYKSWGCWVCHGADRKGGANAPSLVGLGSRWTVETLSGYILDPARWRESDARIRKLAEQYPKLTMPPTKKPESERRALAAWLLSPGH